eukprot:gene11862-13095_t
MLPNPTEDFAFNRFQQSSFQVNKMNAAVLLLLSILAVASATKFDRRPVRSEEEVDKFKSDAFTGTAITGNVWEVIWTINTQHVVVLRDESGTLQTVDWRIRQEENFKIAFISMKLP